MQLDLRSLDPVRQSADRRVALTIGYGVLGFGTFVAVVAGGGSRAVITGLVLGIAGIPWVFAFGGRWRLLDDALGGASFAARGDRPGIWATAPVAGVLLTLLVVSGLPFALALLCCLLGAAAYPAAIAYCEHRYERAIYLDLTVLETRFERISDTRASAEPRLVPASEYLKRV
jgi:hypothetical protein